MLCFEVSLGNMLMQISEYLFQIRQVLLTKIYMSV